jgi:hypothetical protein
MPKHTLGRRTVKVQRVGNKNRLTVSGQRVGDFKSKRVAAKIGRFRARS